MSRTASGSDTTTIPTREDGSNQGRLATILPRDTRPQLQARCSYRPIMEIARGGMADIELAVGLGASNYKTLTILKTMRAELAADPDLVATFLNEARLSARLNHANLVSVYEVVECTRPYIVMEYLEGFSMADLHRALGEDFELAVQLRIISDVLAGLHHAHELRDYNGSPLGIVHRDVSPQNVVVTYDGRVKLLDFGIAKACDDPNLTRAGVIKGKVTYMSPEQFAGDRLDRRSDIFAIGCMLWRAATGKKLWARMTTEEVARHLVLGDIPRPSSVAAVDPQLEQIVMRATAAKRELRYSTAAELRADVDKCLARLDTKVQLGEWLKATFAAEMQERRDSIDLLVSDVTSVAPIVFNSEPPAQPATAPATSRKLAVAVLTVMLLCSAVGFVWVTRPHRSNGVGSASQRPVAEREVQLRVAAQPHDATVVVDGQAARDNPAVIHVVTGVEHDIRVTRNGFQPVLRIVRFDRDTNLDIALAPDPTDVGTQGLRTTKPNAASAAASRPRRGRSNAAAKPHASPESSAPSTTTTSNPCECPFYFDHGIKTYKPECL